MTTLAAGSSITIRLQDGGQVTIATSGGLATVIATPTGGAAQTTSLGPTPIRMVAGPYAEGGTVFISNQSAVLDYDQPGGDVARLSTTDGVTSLVDGAGNVLIQHAPSPSGGDDTTAQQAAINTASAAYSVSAGRIRLVFRPGLYLTTGLLIKPNVWYDFGDAVFRKTSSGTLTAFGTVCDPAHAVLRTQESLVGGSTYYGNYDDIKITGGTFDMQDKTLNAAGVCLLNLRRAVIEGMSVIRSGTTACWSLLIGGQDVELRGCRTSGGTVVGQDGLHIGQGQDIRVIGGYYESGDDAIAVGMDELGALFDDEKIARVSINGSTVKANRGVAVKAYYEAPSAGSNRHQVDGLYVRGITGVSGVLRNGGVTLVDTSATDSQLPSRLQNIDIHVDISIGNASHDGNLPHGLYVQGAQDWRVGGTIRITDTTGGATRFNASSINHSIRGHACFNVPSLPASGGHFVNNTSTSIAMTEDNELGGTLVGHSAQTTEHITIVNALRTKITGKFLGIQTNRSGVRFNASTLTPCTISVVGAVFAEASGATGTTAINSIASGRCAHASVVGSDFSLVDLAIDASFSANVATRCIAGNRGLANAEDTTP
jgi:hypothetical protein